MRTKMSVLLALALACGGEEEAATTNENAPTENEAPEPPTFAGIDLSTIASYLGGTKMAVGAYAVEVRPEATGEVYAFVSKGDGTVVQEGDVKVAMKGADGQMHDVTLTWDAAAEAYVGKMDGTTPAPGPVRVTVAAAGEAEATSDEVEMNVATVPVYGGSVVVVGDITAEVRPTPEGTVFVTAARPSGPVTDEDLGLKVNVEGSDGSDYELPLAWDAEANAYVGVMPQDVRIVPGPVDVSIGQGEAEAVATIPTLSVATAAHAGDIVLVDDIAAEFVVDGDRLNVYLQDANGDVIAESETEVEVVLPGQDEPTKLEYDANANAYVTVVPPTLDVTTRPIRVAVDHRGRRVRGGLAVAAGLALGRAWRARVEAGAGGAIPAGQARRLEASAELRARAEVRGRARARARRMRHRARVRFGMGARPGRGASVRVGARGMAPGAMVSLMVSGRALENAQGAAAAVNGARGVRVQVGGMGPRVQIGGMGGVRVGGMGGVRVQAGGMGGVRVQAGGGMRGMGMGMGMNGVSVTIRR